MPSLRVGSLIQRSKDSESSAAIMNSECILCVVGLSLSVVSGWLTVMTDKEKACSFPFVYKGVIHHECIYGGSNPWCSLTANFDKDGHWGYCDASASPSMGTYGGNANGAPCKFPFIYRGSKHTYCTKSPGSAPWCATTSNYDVDGKWANCAGYTPDNQFKPFSPDHVGILSFGDTEALSQSTRDEILDYHNAYRNAVTPTAANMLKLAYDADLENLARKWVNLCKGGHPSVNSLPAKETVGQNTFSSTGPTTWKSVVEAWYNEVNSFTFGEYSTLDTGHYTQLVWAKSSSIGCAMKICNPKSRYYACNYGPSGNLPPAYKPYIKGNPGALCKSRDSTYTNLCDCGADSGCLNGQAIDPETCKCVCKPGHVDPQCAVDCDAVEDLWYCKSAYAGMCIKASNVPFECPRMCGFCPPK